MSRLYCVTCWLPNCVHWNIEIITKTTTSCFCCTTNDYEYKIQCTSCKNIQKVVPDDVVRRVDCRISTHCTHSIYYSNYYYLSDEYMKSCFGKYLTSKCPHCKGTREIKYDTFSPCNECKGTGGITCLVCKGSGTQTVARYMEEQFVEHLKCKCNNGFSNICVFCNGGKAIVSGITTRPCANCSPTPYSV